MPYKIISLNVDSIVRPNRKTLLYEFIEQTGGDIYLLQETKTDNTIKLFLPGFNVFRCDIRLGWGGVALLIRDSIPVRSVFCYRTDIQAVFATCRINDKWIRFASCYVPHRLTTPHDIFKSFFARFPNTIFGGDYNSRHVMFGDASSNTYGNALLMVGNELDFKIINPPSPTCFHSTYGSYIDKFIIHSMPDLQHTAATILPSFSDHAGISITLPGAAAPPSIGRGSIRSFHLANFGLINRFINNKILALGMPTTTDLADGDCEYLANCIQNIMGKSIKRYVPVNSLSHHRIILSPITRALQAHCKGLQRTLHKYNGFTPLFLRSRTIREIALTKNMILNRVQLETAKFFTNNYNAVSTSRELYATIKRFTGHKSRPRINGSLFVNSEKTDIIAGAESIANALADKFEANHKLTADVVSTDEQNVERDVNIIEQFNEPIKFNINAPANIVTNEQLDDINRQLPLHKRGILTSAEEVSQILYSRPNKKSCGIDGVPYFVMKQFNFGIILLLTTFFNHLLANSYFPRIWRHAIITPIPKPGRDHSIIDNWRPISQLNCISKIFERVIANRLARFNDTVEIFKNQFGFLGGHSTEHALGLFQADVADGLNSKMVTTTVALDLKAAFDTIWHRGLVSRMACLGINPYIIKTIYCMLRNRTFAVRLDGFNSNIRDMVAGVAQGSVTGPPCFNYFLANIPTDNFVKITQFADDITAYFTHDNPGVAQNVLNRYIARLVEYFKISKLKLNADKTELLHILGMARDTNYRLRKNTRKIKVAVDGHIVVPKNVIRMLGIHFQTNGKFFENNKIKLTKARAAKAHVNRLLKNRFIPVKIKTSIYKQFIRPIISYASPIWCRPSNFSAHQMELLRVFERGCLRTAANVHRTRHSYKHRKIKDIYEAANCPRLDKFIAQYHISFFDRINKLNSPKFNRIVNRASHGIYNPVDYLYRLHRENRLFVNSKMLLFHQRNSGTGSVYNTEQ